MKKKLYLSVLVFLALLFLTPGQACLRAEAKSKSSSASRYRNKLCIENGKRYYYNAKGKKVKKTWKTIRKKRYYFTKDGSAATGLTKIARKYYYFSTQGVMQKGWQTINGSRYYFNSKGVMQKNTWIKGKYVNKNGVYDPTKKQALTRLAAKLRSAIHTYDGTWSVYVKNLHTGEELTINNCRMYAASLIKLYAMGAAYERIRQKKLKESAVKNTIKDMITVSDNSAFNTIVRKIGTTYINTWCRQNGYSATNQGHGLPLGNSSRALINGSGFNLTSVNDCGKFLESVYRGTCVSSSASKKMLRYLKRQTRRSKIPAGVPKGVTVANKTGETDDYTHDAAIVYSKGATYILVVMGHCPGSAWYSARHIASLSRITYQYFN